MKTKVLSIEVLMFIIVVLLTAQPTWAKPEAEMGEQEASQIAIDAYIYGYPLVTMEMTRRVITNVEKPEGTRGPMGQLVRYREYPTAAYKEVTAPNADTLYTTAWMDVGREPWVHGGARFSIAWVGNPH